MYISSIGVPLYINHDGEAMTCLRSSTLAYFQKNMSNTVQVFSYIGIANIIRVLIYVLSIGTVYAREESM